MACETFICSKVSSKQFDSTSSCDEIVFKQISASFFVKTEQGIHENIKFNCYITWSLDPFEIQNWNWPETVCESLDNDFTNFGCCSRHNRIVEGCGGFLCDISVGDFQTMDSFLFSKIEKLFSGVQAVGHSSK